MRWAFDVDGVITANPDFFRWWINQLRKNGQIIYILTARNPSRVAETGKELKELGIKYDGVCYMPEDSQRDYKTQAEWKKSVVKDLKIDIWVDNEFKVYKRCCGVSFSDVTATMIQI